MVLSSDHRALYVASPDHGAILRRDLSTGAVTVTTINGEPTRAVAIADRVFVTLRAERKVAVLRDDGSALSLEATIDVGAEPFGIAAAPDGSKIWVASSLSNRIDEIDAATLSIARTFDVPNEPRWIAPHPSGRSLFVACVRDESIYGIDLSDGTLHSTRLPSMDERTRRARGDIAVTPDGSRLLVPAMIAGTGDGGAPGIGWGGQLGTPQITPMVVVADVDEDGTIDEDAISAFNPVDPSTVLISALDGYPSSITVSPDSTLAAIAVEGAGEVVLMPIIAPKRPDGHVRDLQAISLRVGAGARSIAFGDDDSIFTWSFIDRTLTAHALNGATRELMTFDVHPELTGRVTLREHTELAAPALEPVIELGRRLFYASNDGYMQGGGARVSCSTCHFDGREDGITWQTDQGARQTPSLAGPVSMTAPVRWEGDRASVAEDAVQTSNGLMGGAGLDMDDAVAIQAFIDASRDADVPLKNASTDQVLRGRAIFERPDVGCARCHNGPRYADGSIVEVFEHGKVKTRSLVGVAATAPYLRDGSAATLRDVLERATAGGMGSTRQLSEEELVDLEAYLRSL